MVDSQEQQNFTSDVPEESTNQASVKKPEKDKVVDSISLKVGDFMMCLERDLCTRNNIGKPSKFYQLFITNKKYSFYARDKTGRILLNRDPEIFEQFVNYLKAEMIVCPDFSSENEQKHFLNELSFWGLQIKREEIEAYLKK